MLLILRYGNDHFELIPTHRLVQCCYYFGMGMITLIEYLHTAFYSTVNTTSWLWRLWMNMYTQLGPMLLILRHGNGHFEWIPTQQGPNLLLIRMTLATLNEYLHIAWSNAVNTSAWEWPLWMNTYTQPGPMLLIFRHRNGHFERIPTQLCPNLLILRHDNGHFEWKPTHRLVQCCYYFGMGMATLIEYLHAAGSSTVNTTAWQWRLWMNMYTQLGPML
jgi:hypothetical protein